VQLVPSQDFVPDVVGTVGKLRACCGGGRATRIGLWVTRAVSRFPVLESSFPWHHRFGEYCGLPFDLLPSEQTRAPQNTLKVMSLRMA